MLQLIFVFRSSSNDGSTTTILNLWTRAKNFLAWAFVQYVMVKYQWSKTWTLYVENVTWRGRERAIFCLIFFINLCTHISRLISTLAWFYSKNSIFLSFVNNLQRDKKPLCRANVQEKWKLFLRDNFVNSTLNASQLPHQLTTCTIWPTTSHDNIIPHHTRLSLLLIYAKHKRTRLQLFHNILHPKKID